MHGCQFSRFWVHCFEDKYNPGRSDYFSLQGDRKMKWITVIAALLFSASCYAENTVDMDSPPKSCTNLPDKGTTFACELAKEYQVPIPVAVMTIMVSGAENASRICNYTLTDTFYQVKDDVLSLDGAPALYERTKSFNIYKNMELSSTHGTTKQFCDLSYDAYGPVNMKEPFFK